MVVSFVMPWWSVKIILSGAVVSRRTIQLSEYIADSETPFRCEVLAWSYVRASPCLAFLSILIEGRKGIWLPGGVGLLYIVYVAIAAFVVIAGLIP